MTLVNYTMLLGSRARDGSAFSFLTSSSKEFVKTFIGNALLKL
jgi:hypothetical protein